MSIMNRLGNAHNPYQGDRLKVLCVCSAGLLRSPTMAWVFSNEPYGWNTRAAGVAAEYALIPVDEVLVQWADRIITAEEWHRAAILAAYPRLKESNVISLDIPDDHAFRAPPLVEAIKHAANRLTF